MTLDMVVVDGLVVAHVGGEIDADTAHHLTALAEQSLRQIRTVLVLDMAAVTFFCAAGITALGRTQAALAAHGRTLVLRNPPPAVRTVLEITGDLERFTYDHPAVAA
jgi:anti-anti-sigma factor